MEVIFLVDIFQKKKKYVYILVFIPLSEINAIHVRIWDDDQK